MVKTNGALRKQKAATQFSLLTLRDLEQWTRIQITILKFSYLQYFLVLFCSITRKGLLMKTHWITSVLSLTCQKVSKSKLIKEMSTQMNFHNTSLAFFGSCETLLWNLKMSMAMKFHLNNTLNQDWKSKKEVQMSLKRKTEFVDLLSISSRTEIALHLFDHLKMKQKYKNLALWVIMSSDLNLLKELKVWEIELSRKLDQNRLTIN